MFFKFLQLFDYLFKKRSELSDLDFCDALLAQLNVRIYRTRTHKTVELVPLARLKFLHGLDRENAQEVCRQRVEVIQENKDHILVNSQIKSAELNKFLPSVSGIKVVEDLKGNFIAFEGNGRIAALKQVFGESEEIKVEVESYHFKNKRDILSRMNRLRRMNGVK